MEKDQHTVRINWAWFGPLMLAVVVWASWNDGLSSLVNARLARADNAIAELVHPELARAEKMPLAVQMAGQGKSP